MTGLILSYVDAVGAGPAMVGGKGWNLARLDRYGFAVPRGGILAADVYSEVMATPAVRALQMEVMNTRAAVGGDPDVQAQLAALRAAISAAALPAPAVRAVRAFLSETGLETSPLAVRSSATAEDSAQASFAGVHRSFLNVMGTQQVLQAIQGCYASLWSPEAVAYRSHLGVPAESVACAVVLCAMVQRQEGGPPRAAGIAFTCDPRTGQRDRLAISAVPGLAEEAVRGSVTPAEIVVLYPEQQPAQIERLDHGSCLLSDTQIQELSQVLVRVQWALGDGQDPQDVEWAYDGRQFWLLQARPIVHVPHVTYAEAAMLPIMWSTTLVKDAIPGVLTPLSWSTLQPGFRSVASFGDTTTQLAGVELLRRFHGRVYVDMTSVFWSVYATTGISPQRLTHALLGQQPVISVPPQSLLSRAGMRRMPALVRLAHDYLQLMRDCKREAAGIEAKARAYREQALASRSPAQLVTQYQVVADLMGEAMGRFRLNHVGIWNVLLTHLLERYRPGRGQALASGLLVVAGNEMPDPSDPGQRLLAIAAAAAADPQARVYLATEPFDPCAWRDLPMTSPFRQAFSAFLETFGHRGLYEAELASPRWSEDPSYVLEQVRLLVAEERTHAAALTAQATREAAEREIARLPPLIRLVARWLAAQTRQAAARREIGRSAFMSVSQVLRTLALEIGNRLVRTGVLDHAADVFDLTKVDLEAYAYGTWDGRGARMLVADRHAQRSRWLQESAPDVVMLDTHGHPVGLSAEGGAAPAASSSTARAKPVSPASGILLHGIGAATGCVSGSARILRDPRDGARLRAGDIMVVPSTDPGWTPLFLRAGGLVTETGGYLSHGAIVAREYGIPAVVSVPNLLARVTDGQHMTVDGDAGEVCLRVQTP